ncbi:MAG: ABC transporter ATP-binding protein [Rubrivivax sp.]|nr:MAG: ABC transporter ATP-binding protein [Rubrivivax sp.]
MNAVLQPLDGGRDGDTTRAAGSHDYASGGRIDIDTVSIELGQGAARFEALQKVSFQVRPGELVSLLGPSGCGKSTLLGALAGHLSVARGSVQVDGADVEGPSAERGLVFQHHTLFPWKSVLENVAFGLKMQGLARAEREARARELIALVGLAGFEQRYPSELSGGMQQRVEIARVLINRPRLLLMDEPFGALDALTRVKMQELLLELWGRLRTTVMFVTHDIDEALFLSDRILVLSPRPGRIIDEIPVHFARPRRAEVMTSPEFNRLKRHCLDLLRDPSALQARDQPPPAARLTPLGLPEDPTRFESLRFAR